MGFARGILGAAAAAIIVVPFVVGWRGVRDFRSLRQITASIDAENGIADSLSAEMRVTQERIREAGEQAKSLPDTARLGHAVRRSQEIAKQQQMIEWQMTRSRARIRDLEVLRSERRRQALAWGLGGGAGWAVAIAGWVGLWWRRCGAGKGGPTRR